MIFLLKYCCLKYIYYLSLSIFIDAKMNLVLGRDILNISNHKRNVSHHTNTNKNIINQFYTIILHYFIKYLTNLDSFKIVFMVLLLLFSFGARIDTYLWIFYYYSYWGKKLKCEKYCTRTNGCTRSYITTLLLLLFLFLFLSQNINLYLMYMQILNHFIRHIQLVLILILILYSKINILVLHLLATHVTYNSVLIWIVSTLLFYFWLSFFAQKHNLEFKDKYKESFPISTVGVLHYIMVHKRLELNLKIVIRTTFGICNYLYRFLCFVFIFSIAVSKYGWSFDLHSISWEFSSKEEMCRESMVLRADII